MNTYYFNCRDARSVRNFKNGMEVNGSLSEGHRQTYMILGQIGRVSRKEQNKAKGTSMHDVRIFSAFTDLLTL